jgi:ribosomal protein L37AE/L43A
LLGELALTVAVVAIFVMGFIRSGPRCPECGSRQLAKILIGFPVWFCERCANVFRVR